MPSDDAARPVVATSLNPFGRLGHEARCLAAWQALGFEALTFNEAGESGRLAAAGIAAEARVVLDPAETGRALFGKPVPRIAAVLDRLAAAWPDRPVLLVNADIFPALRDARAVDLWRATAPAVALTREDCDLVELHDAGLAAPYRNGLDAFLFSPGALAAARAALARFPVAARMAFGVPGWDFLLGAVVLSGTVGGRIMDGAVLLHERHPQTYAGVAEFAHYVDAMHALGHTRAATAEGAAEAFFRTIVAECDAQAALAGIARDLSYRRPPPPAPSDRALDVVALLLRVAPALRRTVDPLTLALLADRRLRGEADLGRLRAVLAGDAGVSHAFAAELAAILLALATAPAPPRVVPGRLAPLAVASAAQDGDAATRRLRLARLYGEALVERGVHDAALRDALVLSAVDDGEARLLAAIGDGLAAALPAA